MSGLAASGDTPNENAIIEGLKARIRELETALGLRDQEHITHPFQLTGAPAKLLGLLLSLPFVTPEVITGQLKVSSEPKVVVHRLRMALKPYNIEVHGKRAIGYWLDEETKQRITSKSNS